MIDQNAAVHPPHFSTSEKILHIRAQMIKAMMSS
jgi:hypothetical protein